MARFSDSHFVTRRLVTDRRYVGLVVGRDAGGSERAPRTAATATSVPRPKYPAHREDVLVVSLPGRDGVEERFELRALDHRVQARGL